MAHGGDAIGRLEGRTIFVEGALPDEEVVVELMQERHSWARGRVQSVLNRSPERIEPACRHFPTCGGCQWQFASREVQAIWKRETLVGQLEHLGRQRSPTVRDTVTPGPDWGYRNRMDFRVSDGRPALFRRRSKQLEPIEDCPLISERLGGLIAALGDLGPLHSITVREGVNTGDLLVVVSGPWRGAESPVPVCRVRRGRPEAVQGDPWLTETVAGCSFRVTASAFFQNNTAGADALVALAGEALGLTEEDVLLDAFAGGGLFGIAAGKPAGEVLAVESAGMARDDLEFNSRSNGVPIRIIGSDAEALPVEHWTAVVCDPPRTGLGAAGVIGLVTPRPRVIAYVSCDPASLARDALLLADAGYRLDYAVPVDMFPQTFHLETVARFVR